MKVRLDIYANIADLNQITYVILQLHVHVVHIKVIYILLRRMMDTSVNIAGTKQINYVQLQLHVHAVHIRNTNIFKLAWRMIMDCTPQVGQNMLE